MFRVISRDSRGPLIVYIKIVTPTWWRRIQIEKGDMLFEELREGDEGWGL